MCYFSASDRLVRHYVNFGGKVKFSRFRENPFRSENGARRGCVEPDSPGKVPGLHGRWEPRR